MAQDRPIRVRFAPSPTGELHVGSARTALFNWLFAGHYGGAFILRIEDTDQVRSTEESVGGILKSLHWLGLDWDEGPTDLERDKGPYGPYFQMRRLSLYREAAQRLLDEGKAYHCYCTPEELKERREAALARGEPPRYDRRCRDPEYRKAKAAEGRKPAVRIAMPLEGETVVHDLVRGEVRFANSELEDFVLLRSDGIPTYNFAVVIDDIAMKISHVIRADEHLANTPKQIQVYRALREEPPYFAHVSILLAPDRTKLSKRHEATAVHEFARQGFLAEAVVNYLALLGWSYDDKTEIFSEKQLIEFFTLEKVVPSPAIFSYEKLSWMNGVYIRSLKSEDLAERLIPFLQEVGLDPDGETVRHVVPLIQERIKLLSEAPALVDFFFQDRLEYEPRLLLGKALSPPIATDALRQAKDALADLEPFDEARIEPTLRELAQTLGLQTGQFFGILRVSVTGRTVAPPLFGTMAVLGKKRVLSRIDLALDKVAALVTQE